MPAPPGFHALPWGPSTEKASNNELHDGSSKRGRASSTANSSPSKRARVPDAETDDGRNSGTDSHGRKDLSCVPLHESTPIARRNISHGNDKTGLGVESSNDHDDSRARRATVNSNVIHREAGCLKNPSSKPGRASNWSNGKLDALLAGVERAQASASGTNPREVADRSTTLSHHCATGEVNYPRNPLEHGAGDSNRGVDFEAHKVSHRKPELDERPRPLTPSLVRPRDNSPPKGCTISTAPNAGGAGSLPSTNVVRCGTSGGGSTGGVEPCVPIKEKVGLGGGGSGAIDSRGERNRSSGSSVPPGRPAGATQDQDFELHLIRQFQRWNGTQQQQPPRQVQVHNQQAMQQEHQCDQYPHPHQVLAVPLQRSQGQGTSAQFDQQQQQHAAGGCEQPPLQQPYSGRPMQQKSPEESKRHRQPRSQEQRSSSPQQQQQQQQQQQLFRLQRNELLLRQERTRPNPHANIDPVYSSKARHPQEHQSDQDQFIVRRQPSQEHAPQAGCLAPQQRQQMPNRKWPDVASADVQQIQVLVQPSMDSHSGQVVLREPSPVSRVDQPTNSVQQHPQQHDQYPQQQSQQHGVMSTGRKENEHQVMHPASSEDASCGNTTTTRGSKAPGTDSDATALVEMQAQLDRAMTALRKVYAKAAEEVTNNRRLIHNLQCDLHAAQAELFWIQSSAVSVSRGVAPYMMHAPTTGTPISVLPPAPPLLPPAPLPPPSGVPTSYLPPNIPPLHGHCLSVSSMQTSGLSPESLGMAPVTSGGHGAVLVSVSGAQESNTMPPSHCDRPENQPLRSSNHKDQQQRMEKSQDRPADEGPAGPAKSVSSAIAPQPVSGGHATGSSSLRSPAEPSSVSSASVPPGACSATAPGARASGSSSKSVDSSISCSTSLSGAKSNRKCKEEVSDSQGARCSIKYSTESAEADFQGSYPTLTDGSNSTKRPHTSTGKGGDIAGLDLIMAASYKLSELEGHRQKSKDAEAEATKQRKRANEFEEQLRSIKAILEEKIELLCQRDKTIARLKEDLASKTSEVMAARKETASVNLTMDGMARQLAGKTAEIERRVAADVMANQRHAFVAALPYGAPAVGPPPPPPPPPGHEHYQHQQQYQHQQHHHLPYAAASLAPGMLPPPMQR